LKYATYYFVFKCKIISILVFKIHSTNANTIYVDQFCFWPAYNSLSGGQQDQRDSVAEISACERCIPQIQHNDIVISASADCRSCIGFGGKIDSDKRNRLADETLETLLLS